MTVVAIRTRPLRVRDVMTAPPVTIGPDSTIASAWAVMSHTGLHHLLVAVDDQCVGVVDDRSVFAQWPMGPLALRRRSVRELMRDRTPCVLPDAPLQPVAALMLRDAVDAVPVVEADGTLVGIVTASDLTAAIADHGICTSG